MPDRIQLRRTAGWRLPPGALSVARPTRWGNPLGRIFPDDPQAAGEWFAIGLDLRRAGQLSPGHVMSLYPSDDEIRAELRGHDLGCWCPEGTPWCHGLPLLEIANTDELASALPAGGR